MRGRMNDTPSYAPCVGIGEVMVGETISEVTASRNPKFQPGDKVSARAGWQSYALSDGTGLRKIDTRIVPPTAYPGRRRHARRDRVVWPAEDRRAEGRRNRRRLGGLRGRGSVVGQIAKIKGCRVIGFAAGRQNAITWSMNWASMSASTIEPKGLMKALAGATPKGIDIYFENVGGPALDAVLARCIPSPASRSAA